MAHRPNPPHHPERPPTDRRPRLDRLRHSSRARASTPERASEGVHARAREPAAPHSSVSARLTGTPVKFT
jgi:hypothetical protein